MLNGFFPCNFQTLVVEILTAPQPKSESDNADWLTLEKGPSNVSSSTNKRERDIDKMTSDLTHMIVGLKLRNRAHEAGKYDTGMTCLSRDIYLVTQGFGFPLPIRVIHSVSFVSRSLFSDIPSTMRVFWVAEGTRSSFCIILR